MKNIKLIIVLLVFTFLVVFGVTTLTLAEASCVDAPQPDGSIWRTCVDDNGRMYCESCRDKVCSRVSCN